MEVKENTEVELRCVVHAARPKAKIVWYRQNTEFFTGRKKTLYSFCYVAYFFRVMRSTSLQSSSPFREYIFASLRANNNTTSSFFCCPLVENVVGRYILIHPASWITIIIASPLHSQRIPIRIFPSPYVNRGITNPNSFPPPTMFGAKFSIELICIWAAGESSSCFVCSVVLDSCYYKELIIAWAKSLFGIHVPR